jgi:hypothetical protein
MKFSESTITVLKNFASINPSIVLKPGNEIRTMNAHSTVFGMAKIEDEIPSNAYIYDLSRFLSAYSLYKEPELDFGDKFFTISEGKSKIKYAYADPSMIISPPDKTIKIPSSDVEMTVEWSTIQSVLKASGVLGLPEIAFVGEDGKCFLRSIDSSNPTADTFGVEIGETNDEFCLIISSEKMKLIPKKYNIVLSSKGISKFESDDGLTYYIAIESKSTYKKES